jgi:hypothetical protein
MASTASVSSKMEMADNVRNIRDDEPAAAAPLPTLLTRLPGSGIWEQPDNKTLKDVRSKTPGQKLDLTFQVTKQAVGEYTSGAKQAMGEYTSGAARALGEKAVVVKDAAYVHIGTAQAGAQVTKQAVGEYASGAARVLGEQAVVAKDALNVHIGTAQAGAQMTKQVVGEYASGAAHVLGEHGVVAKAALSEHAVVAREALNVRIGTARRRCWRRRRRSTPRSRTPTSCSVRRPPQLHCSSPQGSWLLRTPRAVRLPLAAMLRTILGASKSTARSSVNCSSSLWPPPS